MDPEFYELIESLVDFANRCLLVDPIKSTYVFDEHEDEYNEDDIGEDMVTISVNSSTSSDTSSESDNEDDVHPPFHVYTNSSRPVTYIPVAKRSTIPVAKRSRSPSTDSTTVKAPKRRQIVLSKEDYNSEFADDECDQNEM
jgi:hypothetical protein